MKLRRRVLPLLAMASLSAALAACETMRPAGPPQPPPPPPPPPSSPSDFRPGDVAWSARPGAGGIDGVLAYKTQRGVRYACAGGNVGLTPETPWTRRRMQALYGNSSDAILPASLVRGRGAGVASGDYTAYIRTTTCDAQNRFSFRGLPDGGWFVVLQARPAKAGAAEPVAIMRHVQIRGGVVAIALN